MVTKKIPTADELAYCIQVGRELDEDPHPIHRRAMRWWLSGPGTIDLLEAMMADHAFFFIAQLTLSEGKLVKWIQDLWTKARRLEPDGAWQGHALWLCRYLVDERPKFAATLFALTRAWSNSPFDSEWYEGAFLEYGQMLDDDRAEPRTYLEFVIREGRVEECLPVLVDAGWTVSEGTPAAYALRYGSLKALEVLMKYHGQRRLPLGIEGRDVEEVLAGVRAGTHRLRGYRDTTERAVDMLTKLLDGPFRAVRERKELRTALGAPSEDTPRARRRKGPKI